MRSILIAVILLALPLPVSAADPERPGREFLEMFWMLLTKGEDMGPTDGWFRPGQSRYGWDWLKAHDKNGDQSISPEELRGPVDLFRRLDRDHDGVIKADDLDWSPRSAYLQRQAAVRRQFAMMDTNSNGKISRVEWETFFTRAAKDKGALTLDDLGDALTGPPVMPPKEKDAKAKPKESSGPSRWTLLSGLFKGELGSRFEGPRIGGLAPDFTLKTHDGKEEITLSSLRGRRPVVLVFGNFT
jgi:hypothetical protein